MKCRICGRETRFHICHDCEFQVRDLFIDAIASSMDWMNISAEKAIELGQWVMEGIEDDVESITDVTNQFRWLKESEKKNGTVTKKGGDE